VDHLTYKASLTGCLIFSSTLLLNSCGRLPASLDPKSGTAVQIANLGWVMFGLGTLIWIAVMVLLFMGLFQRNSSELYTPLSKQENKRVINLWIVGGGMVMPTVILIGLIAWTVGALRTIPFEKPIDGLTIEITGHQWWWEVHYPEHDITLKDELRIPVGEPVALGLSSADVIHSFWVPQLHGKFDLVPGRTFQFILQADQAGEYAGRCAEFCGTLHARMTFVVVAMPLEEFEAWLTSPTERSNEP
jgi:cytochrome c oxidase subunit 2